MTVYRLDKRLVFPDPSEAEPDGLLAIGGDLHPERLLLAYARGIFPWQGNPPLWYSPDPRTVLVPGALRATRSLRRAVARCAVELRMDTAFEAVIAGCAAAPRPGQDGTWITPDMLEAYMALHTLGFAHCVEAWHGSELVGGVYGVSLGNAFFGESMFTRANDASKLALAGLASQLDAWGFDLLDCQVRTEHVVRLGAEEWPRERFLAALAKSIRRPTRRGPWHFDRDPLAPWRNSGATIEERPR